MLAGEESIKVVAETLKKYNIERTVIDPVCQPRYIDIGSTVIPKTNRHPGYGFYLGV